MKNESGEIEIIDGDMNNPLHAAHLIELLNAYMADPMGGHSLLEKSKEKDVISGLINHPGAFIFFALYKCEFAGMIVGFRGFSTFQAMPLLNIHDIVVLPEFRRNGIGRLLIRRVEEKAEKESCCKITLEVRTDNIGAMDLYKENGFSDFEPPMLFWRKTLI